MEDTTMKSQNISKITSILFLAFALIVVSGSTLAVAQYGSHSPEKHAKESASLTHALDGKTFVGKMGMKGKEEAGEETIIFQEGKFHSMACDEHNFGAADYTSMMKGESMKFEAVTASPTDGKMVWKGTVTGNTLNATAYNYNKEGKLVETYWVKGELKK